MGDLSSLFDEGTVEAISNLVEEKMPLLNKISGYCYEITLSHRLLLLYSCIFFRKTTWRTFAKIIKIKKFFIIQLSNKELFFILFNFIPIITINQNLF